MEKYENFDYENGKFTRWLHMEKDVEKSKDALGQYFVSMSNEFFWSGKKNMFDDFEKENEDQKQEKTVKRKVLRKISELNEKDEYFDFLSHTSPDTSRFIKRFPVHKN